VGAIQSLLVCRYLLWLIEWCNRTRRVFCSASWRSTVSHRTFLLLGLCAEFLRVTSGPCATVLQVTYPAVSQPIVCIQVALAAAANPLPGTNQLH